MRDIAIYKKYHRGIVNFDIKYRKLMNTFIRQMAVKNRQCVRQTDKQTNKE